MATISIPSNFRMRRASAGYARAQGVRICPYSLQQRIQDFGGEAKRIQIEIPPISETEADNWTEFFHSLRGAVNTFNLDVSELYPHETGVSSVPFRLIDPGFRWDVNVAKHFGFTFEAMEVV